MLSQTDQERFTRLWTAHQPAVSGYLNALVRDRLAAEDLLQETALTALRIFSEYDPQRPFVAWILGVARFKALGYLNNSLDETGMSELQAWLAEQESNMRIFTEVLMLEEEIRAVVRVRENTNAANQLTQPATPKQQRSQPQAGNRKSRIQNPQRFARAAAWIGAFTWFGEKAQAAITIPLFMNKTIIATATAAVILTAGTATYIVHQRSISTGAPTNIAAQQPAGRSVGSSRNDPHSKPTQPTTGSNLRAKLEKWRKLHEARPNEVNQAQMLKYQSDLEALDVEALKELLLEAAKAGDFPPSLVADIFLRLARKSPADATVIGVQLVNHSKTFNRDLSDHVGVAFEAWLVQDPSAAHEWYLNARRLDQLTPKCIPSQDEDRWSPDRLLAGIRFADLIKSNIQEADTMMTQMRPEDVAMGLTRVKDPSVVAHFTSKLPPSQQYLAANGTVFSMAYKDFSSAVQWIESLQVDTNSRDKLVIHAVSAAQESRQLDLSGVEKWLASLPISESAMPDLLFLAAQNASLSYKTNTPFDSLDEYTQWMRRNLPSDSSARTVGRFLGSLAADDLAKGIRAYGQEASRGPVDPGLATGFVAGLRERGGDLKSRKREALKFTEALPDGQPRQQMIHALEGLDNP